MSVVEVKQRWLRAIDHQDYEDIQARALRRAKRLSGERDLRSTTVLEHAPTFWEAVLGREGQREIVADVNAVSTDVLQNAKLETRVHDGKGREVANVGFDAQKDSRRAEAKIATKADLEPQPVIQREPKEKPVIQEPEIKDEPREREARIPQMSKIQIEKENSSMEPANKTEAPIIVERQPEQSARLYVAGLDGQLEEMRGAMPVFFNLQADNINEPRHDEDVATHDHAGVHSIDTEGQATRSKFKDAVVMDAEEIRQAIVSSQDRSHKTNYDVAPAA